MVTSERLEGDSKKVTGKRCIVPFIGPQCDLISDEKFAMVGDFYKILVDYSVNYCVKFDDTDLVGFQTSDF